MLRPQTGQHTGAMYPSTNSLMTFGRIANIWYFWGMITASIFNTVEFYVITAFIAAAVVGASARPSRKGAARTFLFGGTLWPSGEASQPCIVARVGDNGSLELQRFGLEYMYMDGAYSLAVTIIGFDVTIEERLTPGGRHGGESAGSATAVLDCFGAERYHFNYRSEATGRSAAFSLNIKPGNRIERLLS